MTGRIRDLSVDRQGKTVLTLEINERQAAEALYDELNRFEKLDVSVKKWRAKRSNDANAYFWVLCGALSSKLNIPPETIYREMVRDIGGNYVIVPIRADAVERFCEVWRGRGIGWITDTFPSKLHGYVNVIAYFGSSTYDTSQMHRLLDNMITECREHGVETKPSEEIDAMMRVWEGSNKSK